MNESYINTYTIEIKVVKNSKADMMMQKYVADKKNYDMEIKINKKECKENE